MDQAIELNSSLPKKNAHTDVEFDYLKERAFILEDQLKKKDEEIDRLRRDLHEMTKLNNGKHS